MAPTEISAGAKSDRATTSETTRRSAPPRKERRSSERCDARDAADGVRHEKAHEPDDAGVCDGRRGEKRRRDVGRPLRRLDADPERRGRLLAERERVERAGERQEERRATGPRRRTARATAPGVAPASEPSIQNTNVCVREGSPKERRKSRIADASAFTTTPERRSRPRSSRPPADAPMPTTRTAASAPRNAANGSASASKIPARIPADAPRPRSDPTSVPHAAPPETPRR